MKTKLLCLLLLFTICSIHVKAQYCGNSSSVICTPLTGLQQGVFDNNQIGCIVRNTSTMQTMHFKNHSDITYAGVPISVDSMRIDSIGNLPAGICWSTNKQDNMFSSAEDGCIVFSGNTSAMPGQYKLGFFTTLYTNIGVIGPYFNYDEVYVYFFVRVIASSTSLCPSIDSDQIAPYLLHPGYDDLSNGYTENLSKIRGKVFVDANNNGFYDSGEEGLSNIRVSVGNYLASTSNSGSYTLFVDTGTHLVIAHSAEVNGVNFINDTIPVTTAIGQTLTNIDFASTIIPGYCAINVNAAVAPKPPRPGFENMVLIYFGNELSENPMSTTLRMKYDTLQSVSSSSPAPDIIDTVAGVLEWNLLNIPSGGSWSAILEMYTPQTATLGQIIENRLSLTNSSCPELDSITYINQEVIVGSYDPNDKAVSPVGYGSWNGINPDKHEDFTYKIRFQNTGTYLAENVVVIDTISPYLDLATLKVLSASHSYEISIGNDRAVKFIFNQIMLPDSNSNEPGSHGYIQYAIKPYAGLAQNVEITNRADIYFDFNTPILTNTTLTTIDYVDHTVGIKETASDYRLAIYPNPTTGTVQVNIDGRLLGETLSLSDISGRVLLSAKIEKPLMQLDMAGYANGVYLVRTGNTVKKLVKE